MSELSAAEKRVFGELAHKDAAGNIVEKAIGWVEKEAKQVVTLTQHEFNVLVEKAKAWEEYIAQDAEPATVFPKEASIGSVVLPVGAVISVNMEDPAAAALSSEG